LLFVLFAVVVGVGACLCIRLLLLLLLLVVVVVVVVVVGCCCPGGKTNDLTDMGLYNGVHRRITKYKQKI
jgi:hypothetical protein